MNTLQQARESIKAEHQNTRKCGGTSSFIEMCVFVVCECDIAKERAAAAVYSQFLRFIHRVERLGKEGSEICKCSMARQCS
jgi:hypothetical protein